MDSLPLPPFLKPYLPIAQQVLIGLAILIIGWLASKWANRLTRGAFKHRKMDAALGGFLGSLLQYTVIAAAVITALGSIGIHTTSLVAVFASAGLAVGLALQGSLSSFASGVMILFFRPFDIDHAITVAGRTGVVREIGIFSTTLLTADNEVILIPNSAVTKDSIVNFHTMGTLRGGIPMQLAGTNDIAKVSALLLDAAKKSELVLATPAPEVVVNAAIGTVDLTLHVWAKAADLAPALNKTRILVHEALTASAIALPGAPVVVNIQR